ncbi:MAG TPA: lytic transglycosylase domain-containing protein [Candidatus Limnocylindrales bacterium]|nr:lytic transglycosylase domain-containing protein [Candidatus Limnocylindrales bacterium]
MRFSVILLFLSSVAFAGELAVLATGARLHVDRHEAVDGKIRLYNGTGYTEMDAAEVAGFERDDRVPTAPEQPPAPKTEIAQPAVAPAPQLTPAELADAAADRYGLPRSLVRSVMAAESAFQPKAVSPKGAVGLMQLMPETASELGADASDPAQNVDAGARYLRDLLARYDGGLRHALAAYNAGPGAVDKYKGVPPYSETLHYVKKIEKSVCRSGEVACAKH